MFLISGFQQARQLLHWPPWSGAGQVLSSGFVDTVDVCGQLAGAAWSTIGALNLIIKLLGHSSR